MLVLLIDFFTYMFLILRRKNKSFKFCLCLDKIDWILFKMFQAEYTDRFMYEHACLFKQETFLTPDT